MAKKGFNNLDKECPICGSIIWGKGVKVLIEGAKITVCQACAKHGKKIYIPQISKPKQKKSLQTKSAFKKLELDDGLEIVSDYHHKIRKVRQSLSLNQDHFAQKLNEKPSLMRRIEAGKVEPTIKLAKKIERVYNIKLLKKIDEPEASVQTDKFLKRSKGRSLGDIAFIKKKDKKS
ncbi:MAG: multiprotein bridging factor aMBF1 [Promethearchaeota archaeon]|jgi:putative transcription factor